jgi:hypothetical protein
MSCARPVPVSESPVATVKSYSLAITGDGSNAPSTLYPGGPMLSRRFPPALVCLMRVFVVLFFLHSGRRRAKRLRSRPLSPTRLHKRYAISSPFSSFVAGPWGP